VTAATPERRILALGGHGWGGEPFTRLDKLIVDLTESKRPKMMLVPTASAEDPGYVVAFYDAFAQRGDVSHCPFFPWPPDNLRELVLSQDAIYIGGGNTANMLAIWRLYGMDTLLREAWEQGTLLCGASAGMICWFEQGVTDSFGPQLDAMECLGFLPGSACPHYDGEELRRPRYHELVAGGLPGGLAADDGVGLLFRGIELADVVSERKGSTAYRVELVDGEVRETPLEARVLP
jgi:dipeptidase E